MPQHSEGQDLHYYQYLEDTGQTGCFKSNDSIINYLVIQCSPTLDHSIKICAHKFIHTNVDLRFHILYQEQMVIVLDNPYNPSFMIMEHQHTSPLTVQQYKLERIHYSCKPSVNMRFHIISHHRVDLTKIHLKVLFDK